jgi:rhodanese-related sulfurtransferase
MRRGEVMQPALPSIDVATAAALAEDPNVVLLDVREDEEWRFGHAPSATHLAMSKLRGRVAEIDATKRIVCICRSGNRSSQVTAFLLQQGFDAVNMSGGMNAWASFGHPLVTFDGRPGTVV